MKTRSLLAPIVAAAMLAGTGIGAAQSAGGSSSSSGGNSAGASQHGRKVKQHRVNNETGAAGGANAHMSHQAGNQPKTKPKD